MNHLTLPEIIEAIELVAKKLSAKVTWSNNDNIIEVKISGKKVNPVVFKEISQQISDSTGYHFYFSSATPHSIIGKLNIDSLNKLVKSDVKKFKPQRPNYQFELVEKIDIHFEDKYLKIQVFPHIEYYVNNTKKTYFFMLSTGYSLDDEKRSIKNIEFIKKMIDSKIFDHQELSQFTINNLQNIVNQAEKLELHKELNLSLDEKEKQDRVKL